MSLTRSRVVWGVALGFCAGGFAIAFAAPPPQQTQTANSPASEGRPITPAGSLVLDATTGQPAVGAMPMAFVRSPDHAFMPGGLMTIVSLLTLVGLYLTH